MGAGQATADEMTAADDGLEVCDTDSAHGLGVRTGPARRAGEVIHRFDGQIGPELRQHTLQVAPGRHISDTRYIGYLSHSCDPNTALDMVGFRLVALKDARAGELLTIDYAATEDELYRQFACGCGAPCCRRWINGRAEPVSAEGRAWLAGEVAE